jgi:hypothetical protein
MDPEKQVSREAVERCLEHDNNPVLAGMLKRGVPLSRNAYLQAAYGPDLPEPDAWNAEHELEVPDVFRDPDAVKPRARKPRRRAQNAPHH